jgi:hypothetical protein
MSLAEQFAKQDSSTGAEMPRYRCHKEVWALKIQSVETNLPTIAELEKLINHGDESPGGFLKFEDQGYGVMSVTQDFMRKHQPRAGGYLVVYKDGYQSFSPAEAFEEGYTRI